MLFRSPKGRSLWDDARRRLMRNSAAVASLCVVTLLVVLAAAGPQLWLRLSGADFGAIFRAEIAIPPTSAHMHWLGTDTEGRDMVARALLGLRISLLVGIAATFVALIIGVAWGAIAGFAGGVVDKVMMRLVDVLHTVPFIFFVIVFVTVINPPDPAQRLTLIVMAIGAVGWFAMARIVRGQAVALRRKEFVEAARAAGARPIEIVTRHIAPNLLGPVVALAALNLPAIILAESFLSFLGLGVREPLASLGALIAKGVGQAQAPWLLVTPSVLMLSLLLALNTFGDGLRDALDPKQR